MNLRELGVQHKDIQILLTLAKIQSAQGSTTQIEVGNHLGMSVKTVERRLRKLRDLGWIEVVRRGSKLWEYIVTEDCPFGSRLENDEEQLQDERTRSSLSEPSIRACSEPSNTGSEPSQHSYYEVTITTKNNSLYVEYRETNSHVLTISRNAESKKAVPSKSPFQEVPVAVIIGRDDNALADLKKRLESGEAFVQGKQKKKISKGLSSVPDEFNREEPAFGVRQPKTFKTTLPKEKDVESKEKAEYNCNDLWYVFKKLWKEQKFEGYPTAWTNRERKNMKDLLLDQGSETVLQYLEFCFKNWKALSHKFRISSVVPTVPILYGYRRSLLPEALNPKLRSSTSGAEYIESDVPSGSWGF